jgi:hypothetical protein
MRVMQLKLIYSIQERSEPHGHYGTNLFLNHVAVLNIFNVFIGWKLHR